jgi:hypothetical protein
VTQYSGQQPHFNVTQLTTINTVKLSLYQSVEAYRILTVSKKMAVRLSALCAGRVLLSRNIFFWYSFLLKAGFAPGPLAVGRIRQLN